MKQALLFTFLFIVQFCQAQTHGYRVIVGDQAPALSFTLMDGTPLSTESLKGKVVVLQFTASWCGVCRKEMPHLEREVWQRFKDEDFLLVGIDLKEPPKKVKQFIQKMKVTYPFTIDVDGALFEAFAHKNTGVTRNIVIDKNGEIIFLTRLFKQAEFDQMIEVIAAALEKT